METEQGNKYHLTAIDFATSKAYTRAHPLRSGAAAGDLIRHIIYDCGKPSTILSDNGEEFRGSEFESFLAKYKIQHNRTSPGHPQTNGKVERLNHELVQRLQRISAEKGNRREDWDFDLRQALFAFHAHTNKRLGATPFFLQFGTEPVLPSTSVIN